MTYIEIIKNIEERVGKFRSYGNIRIKKFLEAFDSPENNFKVIHVAGTNGKGSTSYFLKEILKTDYKVGLYTSPHLFSYRDRIVINDEKISEEDFIAISTEILNKEKLIIKDFGPLNNFEFLTAIALIYFASKKIDLGILEVGMGGRADSTNIIEPKNKILSLITSISYDHTKYLGNTLGEIAYQKAGIITEKGRIVTSNEKQEILKVLEDEAREKCAKIYYTKNLDLEILKSDLGGSYFSFKLDGRNFSCQISQLGLYEVENSLLALYGLYILNKRGIINLSLDEAINRIRYAKFRGRMEIAKSDPLIILDGAHNLDGIEKLLKSLKNFSFGRLYIISSILGEKDHEKMIGLMAKKADKLIFVSLEDKKNEDLEILEREGREFSQNILKFEGLKEAMNFAREDAKKEDLILITGSLHLLEDFYRL